MIRSIPSIVRNGAVFALLAVLGHQAHGQTLLQWKFKAGDSYDQTMDQNMTMNVTVNNQPISTTVNQTMDIKWNVVEVDAEQNAVIEQKIDRIRMKINSPVGLAIDIDSADEEAPQGAAAALAPSIKALAKAQFRVKMTPSGDILDVQISQEALDALKALPGAGQLGNLFSQEGLANMIKQGSQKLPQERIEKGKSWDTTAEIELPQIGKMQTKTTMTYAGSETVEGTPLERIQLDMDISLNGGENSSISLKDQDAKGTLFFDSAKGYLHHSTIQQNMVMQISVGGNSLDQEILQTLNVVMTPTKK
jgi:hypothetical protein